MSVAMEELQVRHRKEQRDLQSRITQKKKQANKKTRKGVNDECDRLEAELREKQSAEIAAINGDAEDTVPLGEEFEHLTLDTNGNKQAPITSEAALVDNGEPAGTEESTETRVRKPNRQKARLARRAAEQEEVAKQAAQDAKHMLDLKQQERERILESMKERGLQEKEIRADGHCLYSAVADQLEQLHIPIGASPDDNPIVRYKTVRASAANYIEKHPDDFEPFLEEPLALYVHKVRDTGEWGGQLELTALAKAYGIEINVLQDFGRVEKIESGIDEDERAIWLGYYKHGFGLGEHYNSLRKGP